MSKFTVSGFTTVRASAALTTSYVLATAHSATVGLIHCNDYNQMTLYVTYTKGSSDDARIKLEFSNDNGTTWFQQTASAYSSGVSTISLHEYLFSATGNYVVPVPLNYKLARIYAKATTSGASTLLGISVGLGNA
jgi:hypothetical protein